MARVKRDSCGNVFISLASTGQIVVLDDDPTGSQTVHGCPLLLRWDRDTLLEGLRHPSPLLFLLAIVILVVVKPF